MKSLKTARHERGFVLLTTYMVVIFISLFSVAFFTRHQIAIQATERYQNRVLAFNAAEAGIDYALRELATDPTILDETTNETSYVSSDLSSGKQTFRYEISPAFSEASEEGSEEVEESGEDHVDRHGRHHHHRHHHHYHHHDHNGDGVLDSEAEPNEASDEIISLRRIDSVGCAPSCDNTSRASQTSTITVYVSITEPAAVTSNPFQYGIYATDNITLDGSRACAFDSYDSNQGAYGGSNISGTGAIAADTVSSGHISLEHTTVNGSALVGEGGNPNSVISTHHSTINGSRGNLEAGWSLPSPAALPETHTDINLSNVTGTTATLAAGTYHATSIKITGNGKIPTTGNVMIYVDGAIDIAGKGITVQSNLPSNFTLIETGTANVKFAGNGSFYGGLYAPNSAVTCTGNGDIFGAVVAKDFESKGNGAIHFDLAMKEVDASATTSSETRTVGITAWQELNSLAWGLGETIAAA